MSHDLFLYNTASYETEAVEGRDVGLYVCGVTPYDTTHLGHAFTYVAFDLIIRYLRFLGRKVTCVRNITDIDDDILLRARSTGSDWKELGDREYAKFADDMRRLNAVPPEVEPRATEHIPEIVQITEGLLSRGLAYETQGSVYFDVKKDARFGRLSRLGYPAMLELANERGNFPGDPLKRDPLDFVLWQARKEDEPSWPSPWGDGRPGWHVECSAMSMKYLGESFAMHGGGEDLIFPHHECEIAQSENFTGKPFVRHWVHTGMVFYGRHKMSKSLGNMVFVSDLLDRYSSDAVRLALLAHHYRSEWNFDEAEMAPADALAKRLAGRLADAGEGDEADLAAHGAMVVEALADDLDTPRAVQALDGLAQGPGPAARRAARMLGSRLLGLTFSHETTG